jgi:hypothetical protein
MKYFSAEDFDQWRRICFDEDNATKLGNCGGDEKMLLDEMNKVIIKTEFRNQNEIIVVTSDLNLVDCPLGSWLEALGVRRLPWTRTAFDRRWTNRTGNRLEFEWNNNNNNNNEKTPLLNGTSIPIKIFNYINHHFIKIGHLFHNRIDMLDTDRKPEYDNLWKTLFKHDQQLAGELWSTTIDEWRSNKREIQIKMKKFDEFKAEIDARLRDVLNNKSENNNKQSPIVKKIEGGAVAE